MGTRGRINVYGDAWGAQGDEHADVLVSIYQQMDGYPSGLGLALANFCGKYVIVNGFGANTPKHAANGMGCFAAQLIRHLKKGIGGIYMVPAGSSGYGGYTYEIRPTHETGPDNRDGAPCRLRMRVLDYSGKNVLYDGLASDALDAMQEGEG